MSLVPSLLQAIVHVDGEALVMHAGDKPYVVSPSGQVDLATRGLTLEAVNGIVGQLLPIDLQRALDEFGAVQYELPSSPEFAREQFTVVAARGGDDVWVEVRRRRLSDDDHVPEELFASRDAPSPEPYPVYASAASPAMSVPSEPIADAVDVEVPDDLGLGREAIAAKGDEDLEIPQAAQLWPGARRPEDHDERPREAAIEMEVDRIAPAPAEERELPLDEPSVAAPEPEPIRYAPPEPPRYVLPPEPPRYAHPEPEPPRHVQPTPEPPRYAQPTPEPARYVAPPEPPRYAPPPEPRYDAPPPAPEPIRAEAQPEPEPPRYVAPPDLPRYVPPPAPQPVRAEPPAESIHAEAGEPIRAKAPRLEPEPIRAEVSPAPEPPSVASEPPEPPPATPQPHLVTPRPVTPPPDRSSTAHDELSDAASQPAVVVPLTRSPIRTDYSIPTPVEDPTMSGLDRLLRLSAARGASTLYLSSDSRPSVRVDGELQTLEGEPVLSARDVESLLLTLMPERSHEALRTGAASEWICDIEEVGRVRCMSFRDHRGPGGVFRLMPTRSVSAEQLGLPRAIQRLAIEPEGLVLVAGPRSSGKRTLMAAFVDLINRSRRDHVVAIEREINIVHERGTAFISQREVRGSDDELLAAARAALREDPDVLVIEELRTGALMNVALEAAASGHLVIGGFAAHTATAAIDRIIDLYAPEHRRQVQFALADSLRGVIVQVLLKKNGGGRVAAREVLLNTPAVSSAIAEGKTSQLPLAIEGGRRYGMMPLNDALVALVQQGSVDGREAYRYASDRAGLLAVLKRHGVDTSFIERLA